MKTRLLLLPILLTVALTAAACGVESGALGDGGADGDDPGLQLPDDDVSGPGGGGDGDAPIEWTRIEARFDLVGGHVGYVNEVVVDPDDDRVLLVRFFGGVQDCYGANVMLISQSEDEIVVELEVGMVPFEEGDEPVCIEIAMAQELALTLERPAGDAAPRAAQPDAAAAFVGLTTADAVALAESDGRVWRIASEDGESFALTMDYVPTRVNFEVEAGVVADAWMG
jgi:hypothetical protein